MEYKILIVEDDEIISKSIASGLNSWGYDTMRVRKFDRVLDDFTDFSPHLVLMDVKLPYYNGYYWCSEIRRISQVPIVFISSATDDMNVVMGMNVGADDYITKPFEIIVLEAKVQAILRRAYEMDIDGELKALDYGTLSLNPGEMSVSCGGVRKVLPKNEFRILELLVRKKGAVVRRSEIMEMLWNSDEYVDDNTLSVNIARLRNSLKSIGVEDFVVTQKGVGYYAEKPEND